MHAEDQTTILQKAVSGILNQNLTITGFSRVGGGSINQAYKLNTSQGRYFVKSNSIENARQMFEAEQDGLNQLKQLSKFTIPHVYGIANQSGNWYLLMDYINSSSRGKDYWEILGQKLAGMHRETNHQFGYYRNNFIGSLPQRNNFSDTWNEFFIRERITPMLSLARINGLVDQQFIQQFELALPRIVALMPEEKPSFLHGDLWSGNLMVDNAGAPTLIDPAVYYGHREMDLAFSQLFGGFSDRFYQAYNEAFPLEPDFSNRADLYNLYPLLVHLNLFGRAYFGQIKMIVDRFTQ